MKKLGPLISILSGGFILAFAMIEMFVIKGVMAHKDWMGDFHTTNQSYADSYGLSYEIMTWVLIGIGAAGVLFGVMAWAKPRGFSSFLLLALFTASTVLALIGGITEDSWPTTLIVNASVSGVAALGLLIGIVKGND